IALLGWNPKDNNEKMSMSELIEKFSIDGLQKSSSIFDEVKMRWLNSLYIKEMNADEFHTAALPYYKKYCPDKNIDYKYLSELLQSRVEVLTDIKERAAFLDAFDNFDRELFVNKKWKTTIDMAHELMDDCIACTNSADLNAALDALAEKKGLKKGQVLWIYRIALTGAAATPGGGAEMVKLFGKAEALRRLDAVKAMLK
ncbi:MAG: glutamate--tRNA ligase, partial [Clostridiales bacterium]|nr:glutamate--tRNA ligase [Clostridiales bacterium]